MVTRRPFVRPAAEAAELRQTPLAVEALVPDSKQRDVERLVSEALRKRYGGWEFRITVKVWEPQHVVIVLDAVRPPGSSAPPAPPTDSAAAAELMSLLDKLLEQQFPHWDFTTECLRKSQDEFQAIINGRRIDNGDPPTCADLAVGDPLLLDSRDTSTHGARIIQNQRKQERKPWCFIHCMSTPVPNAWPPSLMLQQIGSLAAASSPAECRSFMWVAQALSTAHINGASIALAPGQTFAYKIPPGYQVTIAANQLPNCIVWWQAP